MKRETVTSTRNPLLVHLKKLLAARSYREACGEFAADGTKLLEEAAKWYPGLETVVVQTGVELCPLPEHVRVVEIPGSLMRSVSQMEAPQGAIFICRLPEARPAALRPGTLLLDGIQDPGNLGTILRTADALEVPVVLLDGCADAYNPKTVRVTMGAVFRTQPVRMTRAEAVQSCRAAGIPLLATAMSADTVDLRQKEPVRLRSRDRQRGPRRERGAFRGGGRKDHHSDEPALRVAERGGRRDHRFMADEMLKGS